MTDPPLVFSLVVNIFLSVFVYHAPLRKGQFNINLAVPAYRDNYESTQNSYYGPVISCPRH